MPEDIKPAVSVQTGSTDNAGSSNGETATEIDLEQYVPKTQYEELAQKLGVQGSELGELRKFYNDLLPLLEKLEAQPGVAEAILDGKIDASLAQAVVEGKVTLGEAKQVTKAHEAVKKTMGDDYNKATPEEIEKLVEAKLETILNKKLEATTKKFEEDISSVEEKREFESKVTNFIENTPDFEEFAEQVSAWLEQHPDQYDIETAYYTVKGKIATEAYEKAVEEAAGNAAKNVALNAGAGSGQTGGNIEGQSLIDSLVAGRPNPNRLGL